MDMDLWQNDVVFPNPFGVSKALSIPDPLAL